MNTEPPLHALTTASWSRPEVHPASSGCVSSSRTEQRPTRRKTVTTTSASPDGDPGALAPLGSSMGGRYPSGHTPSVRHPVEESEGLVEETGPVLARALADVALRLAEAPSLAETERRVVEHAVRLAGTVQAGASADGYAGVHAGLYALRGRRGVELSAATDAALERLPLTSGATPGPELAVLRGEELHVVADTALDRRWPDWSRSALALGLRSALAVRLATLGPVHGTLLVVATEPAAFDAAAVQRVRLLAVHAATALVTKQQQENLWQAVDARKLIGQAQGMLMERFGLDTDQAFGVLLRYSQDRNLKLRTVAEQLIEERTLPE